MKRYYIWTIGCQMNESESEDYEAAAQSFGYMKTSDPFEADLVIINTCMVRQSAEDKAVNKLQNMKPIKQKNKDAKIILTGCMASLGDKEELKKKFPYVDEFMAPGEIPEWLKNNEKRILPSPICNFIPIQQGCDNFCSYCIVPYTRGREKSFAPEYIERKARELVDLGAKEITLLGQNVDSYGRDLDTDITDVLKRLNDIDGLLRIRFLTNHPKDMNRKVMEAVASLPKVCENINLPIQSGSNAILKAMNRHYTVEYYLELVDMMREIIPNVSLVTDMIVGFPGETEEQFMETIDVIKKVRFDAIHIAAYSERTGTYASKHLKDDIPEEEKDRRLHMVEDVQGKILAEINQKFVGAETEVLFEGIKNGKWQGRNRNDKLVFTESESDLSGKIMNVKIDRATAWSLHGTV